MVLGIFPFLFLPQRTTVTVAICLVVSLKSVL